MNPPLPDHRRIRVKQPNCRSVGFTARFRSLYRNRKIRKWANSLPMVSNLSFYVTGGQKDYTIFGKLCTHVFSRSARHSHHTNCILRLV